MSEHPFTEQREQRLVEGINALNELGYFTAARSVEQVLEEQRRARTYRILKEEEASS
jgi:hypothetical protein